MYTLPENANTNEKEPSYLGKLDVYIAPVSVFLCWLLLVLNFFLLFLEPTIFLFLIIYYFYFDWDETIYRANLGLGLIVQVSFKTQGIFFHYFSSDSDMEVNFSSNQKTTKLFRMTIFLVLPFQFPVLVLVLVLLKRKKLNIWNIIYRTGACSWWIELNHQLLLINIKWYFHHFTKCFLMNTHAFHMFYQ